MGTPQYSHLWGNIPALFMVAIVLAALVLSASLKESSDEPTGAHAG